MILWHSLAVRTRHHCKSLSSHCPDRMRAVPNGTKLRTVVERSYSMGGVDFHATKKVPGAVIQRGRPKWYLHHALALLNYPQWGCHRCHPLTPDSDLSSYTGCNLCFFCLFVCSITPAVSVVPILTDYSTDWMGGTVLVPEFLLFSSVRSSLSLWHQMRSRPLNYGTTRPSWQFCSVV